MGFGRDQQPSAQYLDPIGSGAGCTPNPDGSGCAGDVAADLVLGQANFTDRSPNFNGNSNPPLVTAKSLSEPEGIATLPDAGGVDVFVVDNVTTNSAGRVLASAQNDRVLRYRGITATTANGSAAFAVLGQVNFSNFSSNLVDAVGINGQGDSQSVSITRSGSPVLLQGLYPQIAPALVGPLAAAVIQTNAAIPSNPWNQPIPVGGLNSLESVFIDSSNHVFITDSGNNRVLGWKNTVAFTNGQPADLVLGQPDFNSSACNQGLSAPSATTLCESMGIAADSLGDLFVADLGNNRVLEFSPPFVPNPIVQDPTAIRVFGQSGKYNTSGCDSGGANATTLCQPIGVALDSSGDLYVADFGDSRILEYNSPLSSTANKIFGQASTTAIGCNNGTNGSDIAGLGADSLCQPVGMTFDSSNNLYVTDAGNSRVLEYLAPLTAPVSCVPNTDGSGCAGDTVADLVLGQSGFTGNSCQLNFQGLCFPTGVALNPAGDTFVADSANSRVVEFDAPLSSGEGEDVLFGQTLSNYSAGFCNGVGDAQVGLTAAADSLCYDLGVAFDKSGNLYVADAGNNRVLEYNPPFGTVYGGGSVTGAAATTMGAPGSQVALGSFTVTNSLGSIEFLSSVNITLSKPSSFSALTLTAGVAGNPSTSPSPITATTTFSFGTPVQIPPSSQITFTLSGTLASDATASSAQNVSAVNATAHAVPVSFSGLPALMDTLTVCGTGATVALVTSGTGNAPAGATVPAGIFSVTNLSCSALSLSSVALNLSNPTFFSDLELSGGALSGKIASLTTFTFAIPPSIPAGGSANFALTATVALPRPAGVTRSHQTVSQVIVGDSLAAGVPVNLGTVSIPPGKLGHPTWVAFGLHKVGVVSLPQRVILTNWIWNKGPINISQVTLTDNSNPAGAFKIISDRCTSASLWRGQDCKVRVVYTPTAKGKQTATITVTDNATNSPQTVKLAGRGY